MEKVKFDQDRAGFPMIWIKPLSLYVHWLPVTKIQFETFICDTPSLEFSDSWYKEILALNPRVSPKNISSKNYWNSFITGIKPSEAEAYANWCSINDSEYTLPTLDEWSAICKFLEAIPALKDPFTNLKMTERAKLLTAKIDSVVEVVSKTSNSSYMLADQMLMKYGVMEWVQHLSRGQEWAGMGQTDPGLHAMLRNFWTPEIPKNIDEKRFRYYGFRLIRK